MDTTNTNPIIGEIDAVGEAIRALIAKVRSTPGTDAELASRGEVDLQTGLMILRQIVNGDLPF